MARVQGIFHFELPGLGLWVANDALGSSVSTTSGKYRIRLEFPARHDDFGLDQLHGGAFAGHGAGTGSEGATGVRVVRVRVETDASFGFAEYQAAGGGYEPAHQLAETLFNVGRDFTTAFVQRARGLGHHWMGTSADRAERTWVADLFDVDVGKRIPVGPGIRFESQLLGLGERVTTDVAQALAEEASKGTVPPLAVGLLADAKYLSWIRRPRDLRLGVLLAAIACEAKIKETLTRLADAARTPLLDLVLDNPRDVTVATVVHLDKTARAVSGRSLREENGELWKAANKLFATRNRIAHGKAQQPTNEDMTSAVHAAVDIFDWIDSL